MFQPANPHLLRYRHHEAQHCSHDPEDIVFRYSDSCLSAEKDAALTLFKPPLPEAPAACVHVVDDCLHYLRRYESITDSGISQELLARCGHLKTLAQATTDPHMAQACAKEARSLVASLVFRFGDTDDWLRPKACRTRPGNVVEMMDRLCHLGLHPNPKPREIPLDDPQAMQKMSALFDKTFMPPEGWDAPRAPNPRLEGPSPDALIEAAQQDRPFDEIRRSAWTRLY